MAAANTDKFMEVGDPGTATTLSAPGYSIGGTSITVGTTAKWSSATGIVFAIDEAEVVNGVEVQVDGTYNEFIGTVASGTSVTNVDWVRGPADRNYSAGALTRVYIPVSAERENRLAQGMVVEHEQDGTHKAITTPSIVIDDAGTLDVDTINEATAANGVTIDGLNIKDSKLVTSDSVVTANITDGAVTNAKLNTTQGELGGEWTDFTPTFNFITDGNNVYTGKYMIVGKTCHFWVKVVRGSTGSFDAGIGWNPTVDGLTPHVDIIGSSLYFGACSYRDNSASQSYAGMITVNATTRIRPGYMNNSVNPSRMDLGSATVPVADGTDDSLSMSGTYELA